MRIQRSASNPPDLTHSSHDDLWRGADRGMIVSWASGMRLAAQRPELAASALRGELPVLPWKGGLKVAIKGKKYGALWYLAMWQGLRGEDLDIEIGREVHLTCTKTGGAVTFTDDPEKLGQESE